jgi:hypothetical protein
MFRQWSAIISELRLSYLNCTSNRWYIIKCMVMRPVCRSVVVPFVVLPSWVHTNDGRLLPKHVEACILNKGVVQFGECVGCLCYITLHYITLHYTIHYTTLHYTKLHYITLHYTTLHYITLHYTTLHYMTLLFPSKHLSPKWSLTFGPSDLNCVWAFHH